MSLLRAQSFTIRAELGYHNFDMSDLKSIQNNIVDDFGRREIKANVTDDFPSYLNSQFLISYNINNLINIGIFYDFSSTGGRIYYQDYSGSYELDQKLNQKSYGIQIERYFRFQKLENSQLSVFIRHYKIKSQLNTIEDIIVMENQVIYKSVYLSESFGFDQGARWEYFYQFFSIGIEASYRYHLKKAFHLKEHTDHKLIIDGKEVKPDWDGLIIRLSLGLNLQLW